MDFVNRRVFLKAVGLAAVSGVALGAQRRRPNVLIIHTDEHRIECLGAYGNTEIRTPHIDALAADGVRYDNSFCCFPVCTPSRYSLLSGLYVHEHRGWSNRCTLSPEIATFPRALRSAGYRTKAVGKMHFLPTYLDVGFDEMELCEQDGPGRWDDDYHRYLMGKGLSDHNDLEDQLSEYRKFAPKDYWNSFGAMVSNLDDVDYSTTWIGDRAVETVETWRKGGGQLLMAAFVKPHHPFDPPATWKDMYDPETLSLLPGWTGQCLDRDVAYNKGYFPHATLNEKALKRVMAYYYATISQIDHHVGRLVKVLKDAGIYDETMIVFTADHGDYMGFHHMLLKGNYMYDPVMKVPLIVKWPGGARASTVSQRLVNNVDLAPTICRVAGCDVDPAMSGRALQDGAGHELVFAEFANGRQVMARSQTRKLILTDGKPPLFFDLQADPHELANVYDAPRYRDEVEVIEAKLNAWRKDNANMQVYVDHDAPVIEKPNVPPRDLSHRDAIIAYYAGKMAKSQGRE